MGQRLVETNRCKLAGAVILSHIDQSISGGGVRYLQESKSETCHMMSSCFTSTHAVLKSPSTLAMVTMCPWLLAFIWGRNAFTV